MPLTEEDKEKIREHMGYPGTSTASTLALGLPQNIEFAHLIEAQMNRLRETAVEKAREFIAALDMLDREKLDAVGLLAVNQLDTIKIREDQIDQIDRQYYQWACRLADLLRAPLYPGSEKFKRFIGGGCVNVRVRRG